MIQRITISWHIHERKLRCSLKTAYGINSDTTDNLPTGNTKDTVMSEAQGSLSYFMVHVCMHAWIDRLATWGQLMTDFQIAILFIYMYTHTHISLISAESKFILLIM